MEIKIQYWGLIEVVTLRKGRPCYRWVPGYVVVVNGRTWVPPLRRRDAYALVRNLRDELKRS